MFSALTMSRQANLPPRCPLQRKPVSHPSYEPVYPFPLNKSFSQHHKSFSQSSILEEQPDWLDGLLEEPAINSKENSHRRSCSDSVVLFDGLAENCSAHDYVGKCGGLEFASLYGPNSPCSTRRSSSFGSAVSETYARLPSHNDEEKSVGNETCFASDSASLYGPNSPTKMYSSVLENAFVSSALSENAHQYYLPYVDRNFVESGTSHTVAIGNMHGSAGDPNAETSTAKRHAGPRSRVRKLQYIAELERRVNFLKALESELAVKTEDLIHKRATLSMENRELKQKMARLLDKKLMKEDESRSLMKEAERLKIKLVNSPNSEAVRPYFRSNRATGIARSEDAWKMLDMSKLNINW